MSRLLADAASFGRQYLRSKTGAFFAFIFPILLVLLFGAIFSGMGGTSLELPVQDQDESQLSVSLREALNGTELVTVKLIPADEDLAAYIRDHSLTAALRIPQGFEVQVFALLGSNASGLVNITIYGDSSQSTYGTAATAVSIALTQLNFGLSQARPVLGLESQSVASEAFEFMDFFLPGVVGLTVMTSAMFSMTSLCAEYRGRGYFKLLATTTLKKAEWLGAKVLFYTLMFVGSLLITWLVGWALFDIHVVLTPLAFVFIAVGTLVFTGLGMLLGLTLRDPESAAAVSNAIGFPMMFLSGTFWQLELAPAYLQAIAAVLPLTYLNEGLRDTMVYANLEGAFLNLGILAAFAVVLFILPSKLMSWKGR